MTNRKKKKKNTGSHKNEKKKNTLLKKIQYFLEKHFDLTFSHRKICKNLKISDRKSKKDAQDILQVLAKKKIIQETAPKIYASNKTVSDENTLIGTVDYVNPRFAFIICEGQEKDIRVKSAELKQALHGDEVRVALKTSQKAGNPEGFITEIIKRKRETFVGSVEISPRFSFLVVESNKMHKDIFIPNRSLKGAKHNDKVIVKLTEWKERDKNPTGEVVQILGKTGENDTEIHAIMAEFDLPFDFDQKVTAAAEEIPLDISEKEISKRKDMRDACTFTIDPLDAKDFDDAISIEKLDNGNYEIGVHIADVSHYVRPNSVLDEEAYDRATSVYLVDRTIPMLPERLSNGLCSLRPNEDKLCFSAIFEMDDFGKIKKEWFGKTVIHSDRRFTYEEAQERIESKEGDFQEEINTLNEIALKLRVDRFANGSINFETTEVKFRLDENGKPVEVIPKVRKEAHKLVEDFMLLANKKVAEFVYGMRKGKTKNTFVYRVHDYPDPDRLSDFAKFASRFGHKLDMEENKVASTLNHLLNDIEGKAEQNVLETLAIRSMAKAKYTTEANIHFGLSFQHYTHFTSPIRRYPDLLVHRLLQHYLVGGTSVNEDDYEDMSKHCSTREKVAADADRASIKYKQVEYIASLETNEWDGIISGVTEWGIFVEMADNKCEGMVRLGDLHDDHYEFDEKNYRIIGRRNKKIYQLGEKVKVKVKDTNINKRTIDLLFVN